MLFCHSVQYAIFRVLMYQRLYAAARAYLKPRQIPKTSMQLSTPQFYDILVEKKMVRSSGFEPPRYCYRQPLKLVRLPVPPRPHRGKRLQL
jgi:hypothetical protein